MSSPNKENSGVHHHYRRFRHCCAAVYQSLFPADTALGVFLPLIVVNCIILGRAEMFASKNKVLPLHH